MDHKENWISYSGKMDDKPADFYVDLGLGPVAPVSTMPNFLCVSLDLNEEGEDGLPTEREYVAILNVEAALVESLKRNHSAIYAGRVVADGLLDFYFYTAGTLLIDKTISESMVAFPGYNYDYILGEDKDWQRFFEDLYPNAGEFRSFMNKKVIENLEGIGDDLSRPRGVDHWIFFRSPEGREQYIEKVKEKGFTIEHASISDRGDGLMYALQISRVDKVDYEHIEGFVHYLWELAKELDGDYDGWGTYVELE